MRNPRYRGYDRTVGRVIHQLVLMTTTMLLIWLVQCRTIGGPVYPLKVLPNQHYVVDQNNVPFFIQGDSAWCLVEKFDFGGQDFYLSNRWAQGFNSIIVDMHPHYAGGGPGGTQDVFGNEPFTNTIAGGYTNLLGVNDAYFANVDNFIRLAGMYGMNVFIYPMYDGYPNTSEGWWSQMVGNGSNVLYQYGQFVGSRYKDFPNIVYIGAGDFSEPNPPDTLWSAVANGILSKDTNHLFTAQAGVGSAGGISARQWYSNSWCNLNCSYARSPAPGPYITYNFSLSNYAVTPIVPSFSREPYYEDTPYSAANTAWDCRRYAWGAVLSGEAGHFYGNAHIATFNFDSGWQSQLWSAGAVTITNVIKLMRTRPWWSCVPDSAHTAIISGYGTWGTVDYISCAREATGKTILAYVPQDGMTPVVDLSKLSGTNAITWWYDPRTGGATKIGAFSTTGSQSFAPPDTNDWVLVLDDSSQNYGPPGVITPETPVGPRIITDLTNQTVMVGGDANFQVAADGTGPLSYQWFFEGAGIVGAASSSLGLTNVTPSETGSYQVVVTNAWGAAASFVATLTVVVPNTLSIYGVPGNLFLVTLKGMPGRTYTLQYTTNIGGAWQVLGDATVDATGTFSFFEAAGAASRFYRSSYP